MKILLRSLAVLSAGLLFALPVLSRGAAASAVPTPPKISLGYSLYGMKSLPLSEALEECARIGYKNLEVTVDAGFPAEPKALTADARRALRDQAKALGITFSAMMLNIQIGAPEAKHQQNLAAIRDTAELARDLQPDAPPPVEVIFSGGKPAQWEEQKEMLAARLREWVAAAVEKGGTMVIGAHAAMTINTAEKLLWIYHQAEQPELGLYYNHIHFELEGMPLAESLKLLGPYVKFVHLQDADGTPEKRNYMLPGEGKTDFPAYFRALNQIGFHGALVVEVSGAIWKKPGYDPIKTAQICYDSMHAALEKSGVPHQ
jgi:inosose dehydratase